MDTRLLQNCVAIKVGRPDAYEISRVARKEVRAEVAALKKSVSSFRSEIAALKRRASAMEAAWLRKERGVRKVVEVEATDTSSKSLRFSAKSLASQRMRLSLSAHECGLLVGVSGQSIYNWEAGKARPRAKHLAAIAALKSLGKKDAAARVAAIK